jgi:RimJ/RimL family protein N-acetyltransferase
VYSNCPERGEENTRIHEILRGERPPRLDVAEMPATGVIMRRRASRRNGGMRILKTERLELRELALGDDEFILKLLNEPGFLRHIGDKGVRSPADAREYIAKGPMQSYGRFGFGLYLTCLAGREEPVGICGLLKRDTLPDADLGFAFLSRYWSKGYATESAAAVLDHGKRRLRLKRIVAITAPDNRGSIAVLEKVGLKFERLVRLGDDAHDLKLFGPGDGADFAETAA